MAQPVSSCPASQCLPPLACQTQTCPQPQPNPCGCPQTDPCKVTPPCPQPQPKPPAGTCPGTDPSKTNPQLPQPNPTEPEKKISEPTVTRTYLGIGMELLFADAKPVLTMLFKVPLTITVNKHFYLRPSFDVALETSSDCHSTGEMVWKCPPNEQCDYYPEVICDSEGRTGLGGGLDVGYRFSVSKIFSFGLGVGADVGYFLKKSGDKSGSLYHAESAVFDFVIEALDILTISAGLRPGIFCKEASGCGFGAGLELLFNFHL